MTDRSVTTAREALMAELLQDVDALVRRLEQVDTTLVANIEQATKDATGKAFLAARFNLESVIDQQVIKLTEAGRHASSLVEHELGSGAAQLVAAHLGIERSALRVTLQIVVAAILAGAAGGFVGAKLAALS